MEYMMVNGYQIPALTLNEPPMPEIGKYGSLRRNFLRENAPMMFDEMMLEGTLLSSCRKMGQDAQQMVDKTLRELMQKTPMPNRKTNPLGWTQLCNSLKQQAEEAVLPMLYEI